MAVAVQEAATAAEPVRSKHWPMWLRVALIAAVVLFSWAFFFELGHWVAEGMPPPVEHLREMVHRLSRGILAGWHWGAPVFIRWS